MSSGGIGYALVSDQRFFGSTATDFSTTTLFDADPLDEAVTFSRVSEWVRGVALSEASA